MMFHILWLILASGVAIASFRIGNASDAYYNVSIAIYVLFNIVEEHFKHRGA